MAFRMARPRQSKSSGSWHSRKAIPDALRSTFEGVWEVRFHTPASCRRNAPGCSSARGKPISTTK